MRKASLDQPSVRRDPTYTIPSAVMPGFNLKIWRTDGVARPPHLDDLQMMATQPFKKYQVTNLRVHHGPSVHTYEVAVETMPSVPEVPEMPEDVV